MSSCCTHPANPEVSLSLYEGESNCIPAWIRVKVTFLNRGWPYSGKECCICIPYTTHPETFHGYLEPALRDKVQSAGLNYDPAVLEGFIQRLVASGHLTCACRHDSVCKR